MVAGEYNRIPGTIRIQFPGPTAPLTPYDLIGWFGMASYKVTGKLSAGVYDSQYFDRASPLGAARYSKDWALSGRYDINSFLYAKAEQHFIEGTAVGYDATLNADGLHPNSKLTILKLGVSF